MSDLSYYPYVYPTTGGGTGVIGGIAADQIVTINENTVVIDPTKAYFIVNPNNSIAPVTATLPASATNGRQYYIYIAQSANGVILTASGNTQVLNGSHSGVITAGKLFTATYNNGIYYISKQ